MRHTEQADRRFRELYETYGASVLTYFKRRTDSEIARDCAADTFLVVWRRIDDVPADALPWLYGVARRVLANRRRSGGRRSRLLTKLGGLRPDAPPNPEMVVVRRAEEEELIEAVNRLRPADRELLLLTTWEELPHAQIAKILGCSSHAVDQRLHRALRRLAGEMGRTGHKPSRATTESRGELP